MPINYTTPSGTGTLSPPTLNDIVTINSPAAGSLELSSPNIIKFNAAEIDINSIGVTEIGGDVNITLQNTSEINLITAVVGIDCSNNLNILALNKIDIGADNELNLFSNFTININNAIKIGGSDTASILAIPTPVVGTMIYNTTLDGFFYYQKSPITGLVLGWYNATGTIKL